MPKLCTLNERHRRSRHRLFQFPGGLLDQRGDGLRLRYIDGMAARDLADGRTGTLGHELLRRRRNHLVPWRDSMKIFFFCLPSTTATLLAALAPDMASIHASGRSRARVGCLLT